MRLVIVRWIDASDPPGDTSWYSDADVDAFAAKACEVVSVGYVKSDTKLYLTLVADYIINDNGTYTWGRPTKIPHGMIQDVKDLEECSSPSLQLSSSTSPQPSSSTIMAVSK